MPTLDAYFESFHARITLDQGRRDRVTSAHTTLRDRLRTRPLLDSKIKDLFLQGSYIQHTAVRPPQEGEFDVDVVLAMDFVEPTPWSGSRVRTPQAAIDWVASELSRIPAYAGMVEPRRRCVRVNYRGDFHMDVVPAHAKWSPDDMLEVPDKGNANWKPSHPKAYLNWCAQRNKATDGRFARVVKYLKCWRDDMVPEAARPKSIILQTLIGRAIPDRASSDAEAVAVVLKGLANVTEVHKFLTSTLAIPNPVMSEEDLGAAWSASGVTQFAKSVERAARNAADALRESNTSRSASRWATTLGSRFPLSVP